MTTPYASGTGWVTFAAIISAITYFGNSHDVANLPGRLFGGSRHLGLATSPSGSEA